MENALSEICENCGHEKGDHRTKDSACPKNTRIVPGETRIWSFAFNFKPKVKTSKNF